jgi:hypothetical protein
LSVTLIQARDLGWFSAGTGPPGHVAVELLKLAGYLGSGHGNEVAAEQFHERRMMVGHGVAGFGEFGGIAEDRLGIPPRLLGGGRQHLVTHRCVKDG